jgi:tight adherence protein B
MLQRETGGNLIEILESIADTIRARFLFDAKVRAMTSEARTSALILGSLPFCVIGILLVMNPIYLVPLTTTLPGKALIFCGSFMYIVGGTIMRDLTNVQV